VAKKPQPLFQPWAPPALELYDVASLQAVAKGVADERQQQHAMRVIVEKLAGVYEETFCPGQEGQRNSDYAQGKRRVGLMLVSYLNAPLKNFKDDPDSPREQG
jgi:hypothetical protein